MRITWLVLALVAGGCGNEALPLCEPARALAGHQPGGVVRKSAEISDEDRRRAVDVVFVAEGFAEDQLDDFRARVTSLIAGLRADPRGLVAHDPKLFNFHRLDTPGSNFGTCLRRDAPEFSDTLLFDADPVVATLGAQATAWPDVVVLLINSSFGRANAAYPSPTAEELPPVVRVGLNDSVEVLTHELGHAVLGLADEYVESAQAWPQTLSWAGDGFPGQRNLSLTAHPSKFAGLEAAAGGMRYASGLFHPDAFCRMSKVDVVDFCAACRAQLGQVLGARRLAQDGPPRWGLAPRWLGGSAWVQLQAADWNGLDAISVATAGRPPTRTELRGASFGSGLFSLEKAKAGEQVILTVEVEDSLGISARFDTVVTVPPSGQ